MGILTQMNENWRWPPSLIAVGPDGADGVLAADAVPAADGVLAADGVPPENLAGLVPK